MERDVQSVMEGMRVLVDEYRQRCLWFLRDDYYPTTPAEALQVLQYIERHGDVAALRKVAPLKKWLSQNSNERSAA
jgi:uncharacterized protein (DUF3820 family)